MKINNLPTNYTKYPYIVARDIDGNLWFWGAYSDRNAANEAALAEQGITFEVSLVERGNF